jgi:mRNA degradation ribonuclease J1/J2
MRKSCVDQDQEFWFGHTQREKREKREERAHVEERREEREEEKLVCVTKPKFLIMVHTSVSHKILNFEKLPTAMVRQLFWQL